MSPPPMSKESAVRLPHSATTETVNAEDADRLWLAVRRRRLSGRG